MFLFWFIRIMMIIVKKNFIKIKNKIKNCWYFICIIVGNDIVKIDFYFVVIFLCICLVLLNVVVF